MPDLKVIADATCTFCGCVRELQGVPAGPGRVE